MPYQQITLDALCVQIAVLLDDANELFWTRAEKYAAVYEALYVWGALTAYWRARGAFPLTAATPYYDLSAQIPALRPRLSNLQRLVTEIQFMLLEAANGVSGAQMSGQVSVQSITSSLQRARNRFVLDVHFPLAVHAAVSSSPPNGMVEFPQNSVYVHRAAWQDAFTGKWTNLWREDAWSLDKSGPLWTVSPDAPFAYSESENSPLRLQIVNPPINAGSLEVVTVDSKLIDTTDPNATFAVPDEWFHAIKYAALAELFTAESQLTDPVRAQYAETRYKQAVDGARNAKSILRLLVNNVPVPIDSLAAMDAALPYWRNNAPGFPMLAACLYDFLVCPGTGGAAVDVVRAAPIPAPGENPDTAYVQVGSEDIPHLIDYVLHVLSFKCGGKEFESTFPKYDSFLSAVESRGQINKAKIRYLTPLFQQPSKEEAERPDRKEKAVA